MAKKKGGGKKGKGKGSKKTRAPTSPYRMPLETPSSFALWKNRPPVYRAPPALASPQHRAAPQLMPPQQTPPRPLHRPAPQLLTLPTSTIDAIRLADEPQAACDAALSFLTRGGPIDAAGSGRGYTLLMLAAEAGHLDLAELLLRRKARVGVVEAVHGYDALMLGAIHGHVTMVARLLRAGASTHATDRITRLTARQLAERAGHSLVAEVLRAREAVALGRVIEVLPPALAQAAIAGEAEAAMAWVECSGGCVDARWDGTMPAADDAPSPTQPRPDGRGLAAAAAAVGSTTPATTAAALAAHPTQEASGDVLAAPAGSADTPSAPAHSGQTMLMLAAQHGREALVAALLDAGASSRAFRGDGQSALQIAAYKGHRGVVRKLVEARSKPTPRSLPWSEGAGSAMRLAGPALAQRLSELSKPLPVAEYAMEFRLSGRWREAPTLVPRSHAAALVDGGGG